VVKLLVELVAVCTRFQDEALRERPCKRLELDVLWGFSYSKQKNVPADKAGVFGYGDVRLQEAAHPGAARPRVCKH
jgi:hypothetical protein